MAVKAFEEIAADRGKIKGMEITYQAKTLKHFTAFIRLRD